MSHNCSAYFKIPFSITLKVKDMETEKKIDDVCFEIIDDESSKLIFQSDKIEKTPFLVNLETEHIYTATISKKGYVKQILTISTQKLSKSKQLKGKYQIEIIGEIFEWYNDEDYSTFEKSFGTIKFNLQANDFIWNPNKTILTKEEEIKRNRRSARKSGNKLNVKQNRNTDFKSKLFQSNYTNSSNTNYKLETPIDTPSIKSIETKKELVNNGEILITNIVFDNGKSQMFKRISYEWGGLFYKLNESDISEVSYKISKTKYGF
jgi:hypothetical protein